MLYGMTILVTGVTGSVDRMVVDQLVARGVSDIRALTTNPAKADLPDGVTVVRGYLGKPETLPAAFDGVEQVYLAPLLDSVDDAVRIAAEAGVRHIVDLAGPPDNWWYPISEAVERSGVEWTHLWPGEFMENTTILAEQIRTTGTVREPYPDAANAPMAMIDIAAIAAEALVGCSENSNGHRGKSYRISGPETISRRELVRQIGNALGRDLEFVQVPLDEGVRILEPTMGDYSQWYLDGLATLVDNPELPSPVFAEVMGRPAMSFAAWVSANVENVA